MSETDRRSRAGFTLIEVVIAFSLLALLTALALTVMAGINPPATEITIRSEMLGLGNAASALVVREMEAASIYDTTTCVGTYSGADIGTPDGGAGDPLVSTGKAFKFHRVTGWGGTGPTTTDPDFVLFAFVPEDSGDGDADGLTNEWKLVRVFPAGTGAEITILGNICHSGQADLPVGITVDDPSITLTHPTKLEVKFTLARQIGYDTKAKKKIISLAKFDRTIYLRNMAPESED